MRFTEIVAVVVVVALGSFARGQSTPVLPTVTSPEMPADVQQQASCVLQIDGGTAIPTAQYSAGPYGVGSAGFDAATAALLLSSTAMSEPVVRAALAEKSVLVGRQVLIAATPSGIRFLRLEVSLKKAEKPWPSDAANKLLGAMVDRLRAAAEQSQETESKSLEARLAPLAEQLAAAKARRDALVQSLQCVQDAAAQLAGNYGTDPTFSLQSLRAQKRPIEMELARLRKRLAALEGMGQDGAVAAWEAAVKSQEERLTQLEQAAKPDKPAAVEKIAEARAKLAEAKLELATARARARTSGGVRVFVNEPESLKLNIAEQQDRLRPIEESLAKLEAPGMAEKLANYRAQQQEEQQLQMEITELSQRVNGLKRAAHERVPTVITVLDGQPK